MYVPAIKKMKLELKALASSIRYQRSIRKLNHPKHNEHIGNYAIGRLSAEYRIKHIAYCLERGTPIGAIEKGFTEERLAAYTDIAFYRRAMQEGSTEKLYVVVDETLTQSQQAVQAGHAVAQFMLQNLNGCWANGHLIYLKAKGGERGLRVFGGHGLTDKRAEFREPDLNNRVTAIALFGPTVSENLSSYKLL